MKRLLDGLLIAALVAAFSCQLSVRASAQLPPHICTDTNNFCWSTATRPVNPAEGTFGYNTDLFVYEFWNGLTWLPTTFGQTMPTGIDLGTVGPIANGGTYTSAVQTGIANTVLTWSVKATQQVTISLQRYLDSAGIIPQGTVISAVAPANTQTAINTFDGLPFLSFTVSIANTSGASADITAYALVVSLQTGRALWHTAIYTLAGTYNYTPVTSEVFISGCGSGASGSGGQAVITTAGGGGGSAGVSIYRRPLPVTVGGAIAITVPTVRTGGTVGNAGSNGGSVFVTGGLVPFPTLQGGNAGLAGSAGAGGNGGSGISGGGSAGTPVGLGGNSVTRGFLEAPPGGGGGANTAGSGTGSGSSSFSPGSAGGGVNGGGGGAPSGFGIGGVAGGNGVAGSAPASGYCAGGGGGGANAAGGDGGAALVLVEELY